MQKKDINSNSKSEKKKGRKKVGIITAVIVALILTVILLLLGLKGCSPESSPNNGLVMDGEAVEGGWDTADVDEIKKGLNEKVEAGMINISMNTSPVFENGSSYGNLMIVNEEINNYPQKVVITLNDDDDIAENDTVIYESKGIPVGCKIEKAKLSVDLPAGTYSCTAMFHNMDPETGNSIGCAGAIITITVKN